MHLRKPIERRVEVLRKASDRSATKPWTLPPFRGLESYEFEHAPIFFGQDEPLAKGMLQLTSNAERGTLFLLVLGASGSGKSSLVKAGIAPKLFLPRRIAGMAFLRRVVFRPSDAGEGEDLFDALARRLTVHTSTQTQEGLPELLAHGQSVASLAAHLAHCARRPRLAHRHGARPGDDARPSFGPQLYRADVIDAQGHTLSYASYDKLETWLLSQLGSRLASVARSLNSDLGFSATFCASNRRSVT